MSYQKFLAIGNVGKVDIKTLNDNTKVATVTLATSEKYTDRNGEKHENTEWHNIVCWRKQAELVEKYVKKGDKLFIDGKLRTRKYTNRDGEEKYVTEIVADTIQFLGGKSENAQVSEDLPPDDDLAF